MEIAAFTVGVVIPTVPLPVQAMSASDDTKDGAAKKALEWLKREIEFSCKAGIPAAETCRNNLEYIQDTFDADEQSYSVENFLITRHGKD